MNTHPVMLAVQARTITKIDARRKFDDLRLEASKLLLQAEVHAAYSGLTETEMHQVRAAGKIAGATFRAISLPVDPQDFQRLSDDLQHIARSVDPLIEAIGEDASQNSTEIDGRTFVDNFRNLISNAIDGNALHVLDCCADEAREAAQ